MGDAGQHRTHRGADRRAATDPVDDLPQRRAHGDLAHTSALGRSRHRADDRSGGCRRADLAEPGCSVGEDPGDVGQRLDVVGQRWRRIAGGAGHLDIGRRAVAVAELVGTVAERWRDAWERGRPSTTSRSAVSSPNRYSSGPATTSMATVSAQPAEASSAIACRSRAISAANVDFTATMTRSAPTVSAAISAPSRTRYGLRDKSSRSLKLPGSPLGPVDDHRGSQRRRGVPGDGAPLRASREPGSAAPPSPDASSSSIVAAGPSLLAAARPSPPPISR